MAIHDEVKKFLESEDADYEVVGHEQVLTTADEARAIGIDADEIGKALVVHIAPGGNQAIVVIPGAHKISNDKIQRLFGDKHARLATEDELAAGFPQFELGAVPPLSNVTGLPIYIDKRLINHETILFNGGTHTDSIKMTVHDFINVGEVAAVDIVDEAAA